MPPFIQDCKWGLFLTFPRAGMEIRKLKNVFSGTLVIFRNTLPVLSVHSFPTGNSSGIEIKLPCARGRFHEFPAIRGSCNLSTCQPKNVRAVLYCILMFLKESFIFWAVCREVLMLEQVGPQGQGTASTPAPQRELFLSPVLPPARGVPE